MIRTLDTSALQAPPLGRSGMEPRICKMEMATGFEPVNNGFAVRPLRPLGYATEPASRKGPAVFAEDDIIVMA